MRLVLNLSFIIRAIYKKTLVTDTKISKWNIFNLKVKDTMENLLISNM